MEKGDFPERMQSLPFNGYIYAQRFLHHVCLFFFPFFLHYLELLVHYQLVYILLNLGDFCLLQLVMVSGFIKKNKFEQIKRPAI